MEFITAEKALTEKISAAAENTGCLIVAIDGRCASGKTTLSKKLSEIFDCNVIHTDDFYLQAFQRTEERYAELGGNLDRERLEKEVLLPLKQGKPITYRPFVCSDMSLGKEINLSVKKINIIEGTYSCHPMLKKYYDLTFFLDIDKDTQKKRILERNGEEKLADFLGKWIPLEEKYFASIL